MHANACHEPSGGGQVLTVDTAAGGADVNCQDLTPLLSPRSRNDHNFTDTLLFAHSSQRFARITQRIAAVDNRRDLARFEQLPNMDQVFAPRRGQKKRYPPATENRNNGPNQCRLPGSRSGSSTQQIDT